MNSKLQIVVELNNGYLNGDYKHPENALDFLVRDRLIEKDLIKQVKHPVHSDLFMFSYNKIFDFSNELVQESRGLILQFDKNQIEPWKPICWSYKKFFNYSEPNAVNIDWDSAKILEKLDGSMCCLWHHNGTWNVSTTGSPDAGGNVNDSNQTFAELFWEIFNKEGYVQPKGWEDVVFIFELMTSRNQIVVRHMQDQLILTGARWRTNGQEIPAWAFKNHFKIVKTYNLKTINELEIYLKNTSPFEQEGFVVVDKDFNRIKVKSPQYVRMHHLRSDFSQKRCLELILNGEESEFCSYFPEFKSDFEKLNAAIFALDQQTKITYDAIKDEAQQKDFALKAVKFPYSSYLFSLRKGEVSTLCEYLAKIHPKNAFELINP